MKPEISVVIPLYNKERYIRRAIDSVLCQTFQNFECIIIDSSTDRSTEFVQQYTDPRIILVSCEKSTAAHARNQGAQVARSDLIAFLDSDDEWQPDHLDALSNLKKKYPDAGVYSTPYVKIKPNGLPMVMLFYGIPHPPWDGYIPAYLKSCSRGDEPVHSSSCAVPRQIFEEMGGFPEHYVYGEDQFLWGKISLKYPVAYCWKGLAIYHTEALGRICDETHTIQEHPFSAYLRKELAAGRISPEKMRECRDYIRRKGYSEVFSRLLTPGGNIFSSSDITVRDNDLSPRYAGNEHKSNRFLKIVGRSLSRFYNSSIHDATRRCLSRIYKCYNPGNNLEQK
jgi:glycosyltransferase involved in cell wall biosynthesis